MRSIRLMAATTVIVALASACGDGSGVGNPPVANFTAPSCTADVACQFTDASTPVGGITSWSWNFGDLTALDPNQNPVHTFAEPGTYTVTLTVTNSDGSNSKATPVTVTGGTPTNQPPVASFTAPTTCTAGAACTFTSTSTDPDGDLLTLIRWDFGGGVLLDGQSVTHTFAAAGTFNVILTVTDARGGTGTVTLPVTISPPATQTCTASGTVVTCTLDITQQSRVTVSLSEVGCELLNNKISVDQPRRQVVFGNVCSKTTAEPPYTITDVTGAPAVFPAGTQLQILFTQGTGTPAPGFPAARLEGAFPNWTLSIDDGGNPGGPGEPDFTDIVLAVQAAP